MAELISGGVQQIGTEVKEIEQQRKEFSIASREIATAKRTDVVPLAYGRVLLGYTQITPVFDVSITEETASKK